MLVRSENRVYSVKAESRTVDVWKEILSLLKKAAKSKKMSVDDVSTKGFSIVDNNTGKSVNFDLDLVNTHSGEVIIKSGGKVWKMGDTFVPDRRLGGVKRPNKYSQIDNIIDMAVSKVK